MKNLRLLPTGPLGLAGLACLLSTLGCGLLFGGNDVMPYVGPFADAGPGSDADSGDAGPPPWERATLDKDGGANLAHPSFQPWGPEWGVFPGMPETTTVRYAIDVKRAVPPVRWQPCSDGRAGCQERIVDWTDDTYYGRIEAGVVYFRGKPRLYETRIAPQPEDSLFQSSLRVVSDIDTGEPIVATAHAPLGQSTIYAGCSLDLGNGGTGYHCNISPPGLPGELRGAWNFNLTHIGRFDSGTGLFGPPARVNSEQLDTSGNSIYPPEGETGTLYSDFFGKVGFLPAGSDVPVFSTFPDGTDVPTSAGDGLFIHDGILAFYTGPGGGMLHVDSQGVTRWQILPLATASLGRGAWDSVRDTLVWTELDDDGSGTVRLYTAPWRSFASSEHRTLVGQWIDRTVRGGPGERDLVANDGIAVSVVGIGDAVVADTDRKAVAHLRTPALPGQETIPWVQTFQRSVWATRREVWMITGPNRWNSSDEGAWMVGRIDLKRYEIASLFPVAP